MKTAVTVLLVALILGGAIFYLGWIQIQLPPETYGVVFTKLKGYDPQPVPPGRFSWRWERLIPTNMTLYKFRLLPFRTETTIRGSLPSADVYSAVAPEKPSFSYTARLRLSFRLHPEALVALAVEEKVTPDTLPAWYETQAHEIGRRAGELLLEAGGAAPGGASPGGIDPVAAFRQSLEPDFPRLEILEISVLELSVPDLELYQQARRTYTSLLQAREEASRQAIARQAVQQEEQLAAGTRETRRLELLARYGELLDQHPVLLKLFYIQSLNGQPAAGGAASGLEIPDLELPSMLQSGE